ncbi:MAG: SDR family oxidoreductase [Acidobacteria bacterium]|nr:SDR family oxidoreductase [Acidobacteriota bacterium]
MTFNVENKTVLVTGANRGIGRAIVEGALQRGAAKVYVAVRRLDSAKPLVSELGERVVPIALDLEDPASITKAARDASDVDLVVNNAGVLDSSDVLADGALESLQYQLNVNAYGLLRVAQAFAPVLAANGGGAFVQLNSVASLKSFPKSAMYSASKAASYLLTQGLRTELAQQNTQVVSVHPGPIATDMATAAGLGDIAEPTSLVADAVFESLASGEFHAWPGSVARNFGEAYTGFAKAIVEPVLGE